MSLASQQDSFHPHSTVKTLTIAWATLVELVGCVSMVWRITAATARKDSKRVKSPARSSVE